MKRTKEENPYVRDLIESPPITEVPELTEKLKSRLLPRITDPDFLYALVASCMPESAELLYVFESWMHRADFSEQNSIYNDFAREFCWPYLDATLRHSERVHQRVMEEWH